RAGGFDGSRQISLGRFHDFHAPEKHDGAFRRGRGNCAAGAAYLGGELAGGAENAAAGGGRDEPGTADGAPARAIVSWKPERQEINPVVTGNRYGVRVGIRLGAIVVGARG